jgi:hypothetical protein
VQTLNAGTHKALILIGVTRLKIAKSTLTAITLSLATALA